MQEDVEQRAVTITVQTAKITGRLLKWAIRKAQEQIEKKMNEPHHGQQTVKQLAKQNAGMSSVEITDSNIKDFERVARKYGVDFALQKDDSVFPPKWLVFFKARDADALTAAFKEYTGKTMKRSEHRPSLRKQLEHFKDLVKKPAMNKTRHKEHGGPEL